MISSSTFPEGWFSLDLCRAASAADCESITRVMVYPDRYNSIAKHFGKKLKYNETRWNSIAKRMRVL
jgi:hypothetical protein